MLLEDLNPVQFFDTSNTDMPTYNDMMKDPEYFARAKKKVWEIVYMSPDEYLSAIIAGFGTLGYTKSQVLDRTKQELVDKYQDLMSKGTKFPMPVLDYSGYMGAEGDFSQEGMHRTLAAKNLGAERIPVMVVRNAPKTNTK